MLIRPAHHDLENWKWLGIIALTATLTLALATAVGDVFSGNDVFSKIENHGGLASERVTSLSFYPLFFYPPLIQRPK